MDEVVTRTENSAALNPNFVKGLMYGMIGAIVGALIWKGITMATGNMYGLVALICAALAGACFGFPTKGGNKMMRMVIGAVLGLTSIVLGYYFIYTSPLNIGTGSAVVAADLMSFEQFWGLIAEPVDYIFLLIGLYEGAKLGSLE